MVRTVVLSALVAVLTAGSVSGAGVQLASSCSAPSVAVSNFNAYEGTGEGSRTFTFLVTITPAPGCAAVGSVQVGTVDGTAVAPLDYAATSTTVSWDGNAAPQAVTVAVLADQNAEPDEVFRVALSNPVGVVISQPIGTATILDDDDPPQRTGVDGGKICWSTNPGVQADVCPVPIRTNFPALVPITVRFRTVAPTGKPIGYEPVPDGLITIPAGKTVGYADIRLRPGPRPAEEQFILELASPSAGVLDVARATITIRSR